MDRVRRVRVVPVLVALAALVVLAAGFWVRARCLVDGGWSGGEQYLHYCYSDVPVLWYGRGLDVGAGPYGAEPLEYPVVLAARIWGAAALARALPGEAGVLTFFSVNAAVAVVEVVLVLRLLRLLGVSERRLLWVAAAPALGLYAFYNFDLLPVLLLLGAVALHVRGHDAWAGAAAGLGAAAKLFPAFLVPLVVLACWRRGHLRAGLAHAGAAALAWTAVNLPAALVAPQGWARFFELNRERGAHVDSLWALIGRLTGLSFPADVLTPLAGALFVGGAAVVVLVGVRRVPPEDTWQLVVPVLVWFLLTNKVYSLQYTLWLVPLLPLVLRRVGPLLALLAADVLVHAVELPVLGRRSGLEAGLPYPFLAVAVMARGAALSWVALHVLRGRSAPGVEPRPGGDPLGGQRRAVPDRGEEDEGGESRERHDGAQRA